jgi:uncharacterized membrane protein SpoIIM required for sporulation
MVFEQFLESAKVKKHALFIFFIGIFYVLVSYLVSAYLFEGAVSVAMLFCVSLLLTPSIFIILGVEEKIERKEGIRHFFHDHKDIFKIYLMLFLGIFCAFLILSQLSTTQIFDYQAGILEKRGDLSQKVINDFKNGATERQFTDFSNIVSYNLEVLIICFILSLFYGAGALFLIVLNASVFAAFISSVVKMSGNAFQIISIFSVHMIPEMAGFLVAAIAGGVLSRAMMTENKASKEFKNVARDAFVLLFISAALIVIAAVLETYVTSSMVRSFI